MFSVYYLFGLDLLVWVNSGGACVVTHNYYVRHSPRDCAFKVNSSGLREFRFPTVGFTTVPILCSFNLNSCASNTRLF
ncbi:unnamed protein product [Boreogadus saida]